MSGRLNQRSPLLRFKDSIKKDITKEVEKAKPLSCYGETIERQSFGRIKDIDELPYKTRIGIAKWFKKNKIYNETVTKLLWIDPRHIKTMEVEEIDPIKKKYLTLEDINNLGINYEPPVLEPKQDESSILNINIKKKKQKTKKIKDKKIKAGSFHISVENGTISVKQKITNHVKHEKNKKKQNSIKSVKK